MGVKGLNLIYWVTSFFGYFVNKENGVTCTAATCWDGVWYEIWNTSLSASAIDTRMFHESSQTDEVCVFVTELLTYWSFFLAFFFLTINLSQYMVRHCAVPPDTAVMWQGWRLLLQPKFNLNCKLHDVIDQHAIFPHNNIFFWLLPCPLNSQ